MASCFKCGTETSARVMRTKRKRTDNSYARYICPDLPCWKAWWKLTDTPKKGT